MAEQHIAMSTDSYKNMHSFSRKLNVPAAGAGRKPVCDEVAQFFTF